MTSLLGLSMGIPHDYSTLCRRAKTLTKKLRVTNENDEAIHLVKPETVIAWHRLVLAALLAMEVSRKTRTPTHLPRRD